MPIKKREPVTLPDLFEDNDDEASAERYEARRNDSRGVFDPSKNPLKTSYLSPISLADPVTRASIVRRIGHLRENAHPKEMRVQDLLANVRTVDNPGWRAEEVYRKRIRSPLTGIRGFCVVSCRSGHVKEVTDCDSVSCPLWPFRLGKNRFRGSNG